MAMGVDRTRRDVLKLAGPHRGHSTREPSEQHVRLLSETAV